MGPTASKKGTSKLGNRDRRSSSRHSTPASALTESTTAPPTPLPNTPSPSAPAASSTTTPLPKATAYLHTATAAIMSSEPNIEALIQGTSSKNSDPPTAKELHGIHDKIGDSVNKFMVKRGDACNTSLRHLVHRKKERMQRESEQEAEKQAREQAAKREQEKAEREKVKKEQRLSKKRSHEDMEVDGEDGEERKQKRESVPSVGAHGLARQDGVGVHAGAPAPPTPLIQPGTAQLDPVDTAASPSDSGTEHANPASTVPLYERAFGKDPTKFDDPTIYDIRPITDEMPVDEKRAILNVAHWPKSDLRELTAGDPPDADFSNAKPANQVNFTTFQTYAEPFIRPFTEEDVAFLKERGDRYGPQVIPTRGSKGYKEIWAAEDGLTGIEPPAKLETNPNEPRGSMDDMNEDVADTDEVSMGPVMNRLMSLIRPQPGAGKKGKQESQDDNDEDTTMVNGDDEPSQTGAEEQLRPVTYLPPDAPRPPNLPQLDYETLEQRAMQEFRYLGFIGPDDVPKFNAHEDDEVAARLRTLQHELSQVSRVNNVRKARVLELTEERMAMQEYSNIADDLDNQVNAAYLKRNRSLAKPTKKSSSAAARLGQKGVAVAGAGGGRGVSDGVRVLMQKRKDWISMVGPVVAYGRPQIPGDGETVFDDESIRRLERSEREAEMAEVEGE